MFFRPTSTTRQMKNSQPLGNFTILDFSQAWAAPIASMMMADLGADVVKVEAPVLGDQVRQWTRTDLNGLSPYYLAANRNKRSIVIDLKRPEGRALALDLSAKADVLLENFRPGVMDRMGLSYAQVQQRNERIVYCSVSGYGADGPLSGRAAYDLMIQAEAGLLSVTGQEEGPLVKLGVPIADVMSANIAAFTILGALLGRERSGKGQHLDISMLEVATTTMAYLLVDYELSGKKAKPMGSANQLLAPYQVYETRTTPMVIGVLSELHWLAFCKAIEKADLAKDSRFSVAALRVANLAALNAIIIPVFRERAAQEWQPIFEGAGIACGFVNDVQAVLSHPQHLSRGFFDQLEVAGRQFRLPGAPWKLEGRSLPVRPPHHGEQTAEVLGEWLGMSASGIDQLFRSGVVATNDVKETPNV